MNARPVAVVVVGDLARSPRMLNHARELACIGRPVCLVGLREREFDVPAGVEVAPLQGWRGLGALGMGGAAVRMGLTFFDLLEVLLDRRPSAIMLQNPPTFPALLAGWIAARWLGALLIIDWHNYGYTMLALRLGADHIMVRLAARHEGWMARRAVRHFCVSRAMQADLETRFAIRAAVLCDRPLSRPLLTAADHSQLIVVCPAGWTVDEDMALLLDALELLTARAIEVHLTGDGPLRAVLAPRIAALRASGLALYTGFRKEGEYRALLAQCDLGLSLHRSSSGLDLAMKVVDLFAAGVPVCAFDYGGALSEQIIDRETGFLFRTAGELAALFDRLARDRSPLAVMSAHIGERWSTTWNEEWLRTAAPVFEGAG